MPVSDSEKPPEPPTEVSETSETSEELNWRQAIRARERACWDR